MFDPEWRRKMFTFCNCSSVGKREFTRACILEVATVEDYEADLIAIRDKLLAAGACVALVSPPVLGEDSESVANVRAAAYAMAVKQVAEVVETSLSLMIKEPLDLLVTFAW
eukprot:4629630-Amphidinium_carterae.1